jgi:simple sugar transport system substrate-binding protein
MNDFVNLNPVVPDDVKKLIEKAKAGLKDGSLAVFKGPLVDNAGKEVLAKGKVADEEWNGKVTFYLQGVEGNSPAAK